MIMNRWLMMMLTLLIGCSLPVPHTFAASNKEEPEFRLIVKASAEATMQTELSLQSKSLLKGLHKSKSIPGTAPRLMTDTSLSVRDQGTETMYKVDGNLDLYDTEHRQMRVLPAKAKEELAVYVRSARQAHYGKPLPWEEAKQIVERKAVVRVIDLETGLAFQVQRRAGSHHADMQPLTKADTAIMKEIYKGEWSWRRRAVLVEKDGQRLAASMHGMPHGGDGIPDNDFSGHFCIHFLGSTTHRSNQVDPDHQWMIYKAAGQWDDIFAKASPYEIAESFLIALNQQDRELLRHGFADETNPQLRFYMDVMSRLKAVKKITPIPAQNIGDALSVEISVPVTVWFAGQKPENQVFVFTMTRTDLASPWKIAALSAIS